MAVYLGSKEVGMVIKVNTPTTPTPQPQQTNETTAGTKKQ